MNQEQLKQQITTYLAEENKLYQDWWNELNPPLEGVEQVSLKENIEEYQRRFSNWFQQWYEENRLPFKKACCEIKIHGKTICERWLEIRKEHDFHKKQDLTVSLIVDLIISAITHLPHTPVSITIIILNGYLDKICND